MPKLASICLVVIYLLSAHAVAQVEPPGPDSIDLKPPEGQTNNIFDPGFGGGGGGPTVDPQVMVEHIERQGVDERLQADDAGLMGDQIDPNTGSLVFSHTDVSIPGNSGLAVAIVRRREQGLKYYPNTDVDFGDWILDVPRISTVLGFRTTAGSQNETTSWSSTRCTDIGAPPPKALNLAGEPVPQPPGGGQWTLDTIVLGHQYSNGLQLELPGQGSQMILDSPQGTAWDTTRSGGWMTRKITLSNWVFDCETGGASDGGQSFIGYAPNGDKYEFTRLVYREATWIPVGPSHLARWHAIMLATRVTDVNGNTVDYTYDSNARLTRIEANDGRVITLSYTGSSKMIDSVTANGRTWTYTYVNGSWGKELNRVTLPDSRYWEFSLALMERKPNAGVACTAPDTKVEMRHPNGVDADFWLRETKHGRTRIPTGWDHGVGYCNNENPEAKHAYFEAMSIWQKNLSGPGYPSATWTYTYLEDYGNFVTGPDTLPDTRWTQVIDPLGYKTVYHHHRRVDNLENLLVKQELFPTASSTTPIESTTYTYVVEGKAGVTYLDNFENEVSLTQPRHQDVVTIARGTDTYTTDYDYETDNASAGYSYGSPTYINQFNNYTITAYGPTNQDSVIALYHDKDLWRLTLPSSVTRNGKLFESYTYDGLGRVTQVDAFSEPLQEISYYCDVNDAPCSDSQSGTVAWVEDALGRRTTFSNYHRGKPKLITRPDLSTLQATVDNNGWVRSETDPMGNVTQYDYTDVGWLKEIDRPAPWSDTTIEYESLNNPSQLGYGILQKSTRGSMQITTSYDGLSRPFLVKTAPTSGIGATSYVKTSYDALSRQTFVSQPSTSSNPTLGTDTTYDALGRPVTVAENMGDNVTTTTQYLNQSIVRVTDPEGHVTHRFYNAFGTPDNKALYRILQPEGVNTYIYRNSWLRPTTVRQTGYDGTTFLDKGQYHFYDSKLRRCRMYTPEGGSTAFAYNAADEMVAYAKGLTTGATCPTPAGASLVQLTYDDLGRLELTDFSSPTTPDISRTYDDNGNVLTVDRGGVNWTYTYAGDRYLDSETLAIDGRTYGLSYVHNAEGIVTQRVLPSGRTIDLTINSLGQVHKVSEGSTDYAYNVYYDVTGTMGSAFFSNGFRRTTAATPRQQPHIVAVDKTQPVFELAVHQTYTYDKRGDITNINDLAVSGNNRVYEYDGLSRLKEADGPWGAGATYNYDGLGNLRSKTIGGVTTAVTYDNATNRATYTTHSAGGAGSIGYDARGNVTALGAQTFTYDYADQPVSHGGSVSATYTYDGNLKRVKQTINGTTIYSVYDLAGNLVYRDNDSTLVKTDYVSMPFASLRLKSTGAVEHIYSDHLGSPIVATDGAGTILWREKYKPYGQKMEDPLWNNDEPGFTGHVQDDVTDLTYMQARFYDPEIGRFLSIDPVGFDATLPSSFGRYTYVSNNPANRVDPFGLQECSRGVSRSCRVERVSDWNATDKKKDNRLQAISNVNTAFTQSSSNAMGSWKRQTSQKLADSIAQGTVHGELNSFDDPLADWANRWAVLWGSTLVGPVIEGSSIAGAAVYSSAHRAYSWTLATAPRRETTLLVLRVWAHGAKYVDDGLYASTRIPHNLPPGFVQQAPSVVPRYPSPNLIIPPP